jgi:NAD(P)-dependent dehydrogenase (short-subunit alcohol dehydrogenase family)
MLSTAPNQPIPGSALYMTSKLAQLGMIRSVDRVSAKIGVNLAIVSPVLPNGVAPGALADTIVYAAAETSLSQAGVSYSLTAEDAGSVRVALQDTIREGVFGELSARMDKIYGLQPMIPR